MRLDAYRAVLLPDSPLEVKRGGDGRTLVGYAAVFDTPTAIRDAQGDYDEQNAPHAFNKTIADRGTRFLVTYNHGKDLYGRSSAAFAIPLGAPSVVKPDGRGVYTETPLHNTPLCDEILEGARSGAIPGMSYIGAMLKSDPEPPRGGYKAGRGGARTLVTRHEIAMKEFGPTPMPSYDAAAIIGVRSLVDSIEGLTRSERAELVALLQEARSATQDEPADLDTPPGAVADDEPPVGHSARHLTPKQRIDIARAALTVRGGHRA